MKSLYQETLPNVEIK